MIKVNEGDVQIKGDNITLQSDLACIVNALVYGDNLTREEVLNCVEIGMKTDEEIRKKVAVILTDMISKMFSGEDDEKGEG